MSQKDPNFSDATAAESAADQPKDVAEAIGQVRLFEGLSKNALQLIASIAKEERFGAGTTIFREGDGGDKLYLILEGKIRISKQMSGLGEEALAVLGPGNAFGEMSLIDDFPRSADAVVHNSCRLLSLSKDELEDLLFVHKDLAYEILWNFVSTLSARLRETNAKMTFLSATGKF